MLKASSFLKRKNKQKPSLQHNTPLLLPELILSAGKMARLMQQGKHGKRRVGIGENFWQFRPHQPHEPASYIDWRQSARSSNPSHLWVKEREHQTPHHLSLWIDFSPSMQWHSTPSLPRKDKVALTSAIALAHSVMKAGEHIHILGQKKTYHNPQHLPILAQELQNLYSKTTTYLPPIEQAHPHAHLLIISDFLWEEELYKHVFSLCRKRPGRSFFLALHDPAERNLPYKGRIQFTDPEGAHNIILPAVESLKKNYQDAFAKHLSQLISLKGDRNEFFTHITNDPLLPLLLKIHAQLELYA